MERHATAGKRVYAKSVSRVRIPLAPQDKRRIFKQLRKSALIVLREIEAAGLKKRVKPKSRCIC